MHGTRRNAQLKLKEYSPNSEENGSSLNRMGYAMRMEAFRENFTQMSEFIGDTLNVKNNAQNRDILEKLGYGNSLNITKERLNLLERYVRSSEYRK